MLTRNFLLLNVFLCLLVTAFYAAFSLKGAFANTPQSSSFLINDDNRIKNYFSSNLDKKSYQKTEAQGFSEVGILSDLAVNADTNEAAIRDPNYLLESILSSDSELANGYEYKTPTTGALLVYENKKIRSFIKMYTGKKRRVFQKGLERYNTYMPVMKKIFAKHGLPAELCYLAIVESNLNPKAVSKAGAVGIWQFMASTGRVYGLNSDSYYDDRLNVIKATHAAARHLKDLYHRFNSWELALAAYNSGAGKVSRAIKRNLRLKKATDFWHLRLPRETRGYVPAFFAVNLIMKNLKAYGFDDKYIDESILPVDFAGKQISLPGGISFKQLEKLLAVDKQMLAYLNPEYKYQATPPKAKSYSITIPSETRVDLRALAKAKPEKLDIFVRYRIKRGDNFYTIARRHGTSVSNIRKLNPNVSPKRLMPGKYLVVSVSGTSAKTSRLVDRSANVYRVIKGDTLSEIAQRFGVSINQLLRLNNMSFNKVLHVGTELKIR